MEYSKELGGLYFEKKIDNLRLVEDEFEGGAQTLSDRGGVQDD